MCFPAASVTASIHMDFPHYLFAILKIRPDPVNADFD